MATLTTARYPKLLIAGIVSFRTRKSKFRFPGNDANASNRGSFLRGLEEIGPSGRDLPPGFAGTGSRDPAPRRRLEESGPLEHLVDLLARRAELWGGATQVLGQDRKTGS